MKSTNIKSTFIANTQKIVVEAPTKHDVINGFRAIREAYFPSTPEEAWSKRDGRYRHATVIHS